MNSTEKLLAFWTLLVNTIKVTAQWLSVIYSSTSTYLKLTHTRRLYKNQPVINLTK